MIRRVAGFALVAAAIALGTGCFGKANEKNWGEKSSRVSCKMAKRCSTSQFFFHYDNMADCMDDAMDLYDDRADFYEDNCEFDKKQARKCIRLMKNSCKSIGGEYDELYDVCSTVWACGGATIEDTGTSTGGTTTDPPTLPLAN
ncbi:MAG: hypothetical protein ACI8PZ_003334 [Myxococcota bacterium]|jgi:hypothetical protein